MAQMEAEALTTSLVVRIAGGLVVKGEPVEALELQVEIRGAIALLLR